MSARIENDAIQLRSRADLDWTVKYPATAAALAKLKVEFPISTENFAVFVRMA
jgi:ATP-dependent DNA ligase